MHKPSDDNNTQEDGYQLNHPSHSGDPLGMYVNDISARIVHESGFSNPSNLFDDINSEDSKWLKVAKGHLKKNVGPKNWPTGS